MPGKAIFEIWKKKTKTNHLALFLPVKVHVAGPGFKMHNPLYCRPK